MIITAEVSELTRKIKLPTDRVLSVNGDYQVDGIAFKLPATYEGDFDFSTAAARVHWTGVDKVEHTNLITEVDGNGYPLWIMPSELTQGGHGVIELAVSFVATDATAAVTKRWISDPVSFRNRRTVNGSNEDEEAEEETTYDRLASAVASVRAAQAEVEDTNAVLSSLTGSAPVPVENRSDMVDNGHLYLYTGDETGLVTGNLYYYVNGTLTNGGKYGSMELDTTLTDNSKAAPAGMVGQIKEDLSTKTGLSEEAKQALLACFAKVAWIDEHGQDYYDALEDALYPPAVLTGISAVYTQSGTVYNTDSLDSLKSDVVVTAHYSDGTYRGVTTYTLSGALTVGTSTITVAYSGKTTTFTVTVTQARVPEGFREVEWIGSGAGNLGMYIGNESFRMPSAFRAEAKAQLTGWNEGATYGNIIAVFQPNKTTYGYELAYKKDDSTIVSFLGAQSAVTPSDISAEIILGTVCDGTNEQVYIVVNGERVYGESTAVSRNYTGAKVGVLAGGNTVLNQFVGKLFYLNIYDSTDALVSELIPCYRVSDGVIGLYDAIADEFITNANDTYTKGADV